MARKIGFADVRGPIEAASPENKELLRESLALGPAAVLDVEDRETATGYHVITDTADGMGGDGVALHNLLYGSQTITPVAGAIPQPYPLDPAVLGGRTVDVAEAQANHSLNSLVMLTSANSNAGSHQLIYPDPVDAAVLAGLEGKTIQTTLVNNDAVASLTVGVAPYVAGRRRARWRGALADPVLAPGDELLARAHWFRGELDVEQFIRRAVWAEIALVAGSAEITSSTANTIPGLLTGDFPILQTCRIAGQGITLPNDKGYNFPTVPPYGPDGRLVQPTPNRSTRVVWTWATADGDFATGSFTGATTRMISAAYRNVGAVRQVAALAGEASTSIVWPTLGPRAPGSWVIGLLNATVLAEAVNPAGSTLVIEHDGGTGTALSLWHYGAGEAYAPAPTPVPSCSWVVTVLEVTPWRLD